MEWINFLVVVAKYRTEQGRKDLFWCMVSTGKTWWYQGWPLCVVVTTGRQEAKKNKKAEIDLAYHLQGPPLWLYFLSARPHVQPVTHLGTKCSNTWAVEDNSLSNGNTDQSVWLLHFFHFYRADMSAEGMNRSAIYRTSAVPALRTWRPWAT